MSEANGLAPCCANCRFFVKPDDGQGTCNRYAPRPAQDEAWAEWPWVLPHNWCGEWAQPLSDDELFTEFLARNAGAMPLLAGIPVPPTDDQPGPKAPQVLTYDDPFTDPLL